MSTVAAPCPIVRRCAFAGPQCRAAARPARRVLPDLSTYPCRQKIARPRSLPHMAATLSLTEFPLQQSGELITLLLQDSPLIQKLLHKEKLPLKLREKLA